MNTWAHDLASTHPTISADVNFVADQWSITAINGWKDFCHAKLVQRVEEACKRVKEQFRLQDEEDDRAYSSQLMMKIPRQRLGLKRFPGINMWMAYVNGG